jgi:thymidylate synthase (FAD)
MFYRGVQNASQDKGRREKVAEPTIFFSISMIEVNCHFLKLAWWARVVKKSYYAFVGGCMTAALRIVVPRARLITPRPWLEDMAVLVETCGRVSHKSEHVQEEGSACPFIQKVAFRLGHESITEHVAVTVRIIGSRSMSHQLVRHRIGSSFTQESQRYCDYSNQKKFNALSIIVPPSIVPCQITDPKWKDLENVIVTHVARETDHDGIDELVLCYLRDGLAPIPIRDVDPKGIQLMFFSSILSSYQAYLFLRDAGIPSEDARFVLPNANKTELATTFNIRQWRHVFKMRCDRHAQWEIRFIMQEILRSFLDSPLKVFFEDLRVLLEEN